MSSRCLKRSTDFWKMQTNQRKADTSWSSALSLHPMENTNNLGDDVLSTFQNWPLQIRWCFPSPTTFPCFNDPIFANWMKPLQISFGFFNLYKDLVTALVKSQRFRRVILLSMFLTVVSGCSWLHLHPSYLPAQRSQPTCRWLQHGQLLWKTNIWTSGGQKNMEKERSSNFWKMHLIKSCSCILTGCLFRPVEYKP